MALAREEFCLGFLGGFNDFMYDPGSTAGSYFKKAVSGVGNFACDLYKKHPGAFTVLDPFDFHRGFWDEVCENRPPGLPVPPSAPYEGGQCKDIEYNVVINHEYTIPGYQTVKNQVVSLRLFGKIGAIYARPDSGSQYNAQLIANHRDGLVVARNFSGDTRYPRVQVKITSIRVSRVDGQLDNCGNLPIGYPPQELTEVQRTTNINIGIRNGASVSIPVVIGLAKAEVDFNLNVPLTFNLGGNKFYFDFDGVHSGEPGGTAQKDAKDIKDKLDDLTDPPNPDEDPRLTPTSPPVADSGEEDELSRARWIKIDLTTLPDKAQYSRSGRPVYFAGWLEFHKEGYALPRQQINYQKTIFRFPDGADGYSYTFTNGAAGSVTVYTEEQEEDG